MIFTRLIKLACGLTLAFTGMSASAACTDVLCSGVGTEAITSLWAGNDGHIYFQAPEASRANLACTLRREGDNYYIVLRNTHPTFKETYSAALMALASAKVLQIRMVPGPATDPCVVSWVRVLP